MTEDDKLERTTLRMNPDVYRQIKVLAAETDRTVQSLVEEALVEYLGRHKKRKRRK